MNTQARTQEVALSSGKDVDYENFPVGSWLLPAGLRPHIATFYQFARAADDIADSAMIPAEEKLRRLNEFEAVLSGQIVSETAPRPARQMRESLQKTATTPQHCFDLLAAFKQDARKRRYEDWRELVDYCLLSAAPVGRYLLDLHGGGRSGYGPSDALCIALQVLNHLQDCQADYLDIDRVYLPQDWLEHENITVECLAEEKSSPALRHVLDHILDKVDQLMIDAAALPSSLRSRRLAMESAAIINIANRLSEMLRRRDPLAGRVSLNKPQYFQCCISGAFFAFLRHQSD